MRYGIKRLSTGNWTVFNGEDERVVFSHGFADSQTASDVAWGFTRETDRVESEMRHDERAYRGLGLRPYQRETVEAILDIDSRVKHWKRRAAKANERADMAEARLRTLRDPMKIEISEKKLLDIFYEAKRDRPPVTVGVVESVAEKNARGIRAVEKYVKFCCAIGREPADGGFASVKDVKLSFPSLSGTGHMSEDEANRCFGKFGATLYFTNPPEEVSILDRYNTEATERPRSEKVSPWVSEEQQPSRIHREGSPPRQLHTVKVTGLDQMSKAYARASEGIRKLMEEVLQQAREKKVTIVYRSEKLEIIPISVHQMRGQWFLRAMIFLPNGKTSTRDLNLALIRNAKDLGRLKEMEAAALAVVEGAEPISAFKKVLDRD